MNILPLSRKNLFNDVVKQCRKGKYILIYVDDEKSAKEISAVMENDISKNRGILHWNGIVVILLEKNKEVEKYVDIIYKLTEV